MHEVSITGFRMDFVWLDDIIEEDGASYNREDENGKYKLMKIREKAHLYTYCQCVFHGKIIY
jgi:hypothetical protein